MVDMENFMKQLEEARKKSAMEKEKTEQEKKEKEAKRKNIRSFTESRKS
jgi:succinate dehydrogenase/fumarate reductase-like Fe-S protein